MKGTDMALLAGVAIVGYGLVTSDFFKGVGSAVGGVGSGIGFAGEAMGYNLADLFNAVGQLGQSSQLIIRESGLQTREIIRETGEVVTRVVEVVGEDVVGALDYTGDVVVDITGAAATASGSLRDVSGGFWDAFSKTWNLNEPTNIFTTFAGWGGGALSWVKKQVSPSTTSLITGAAISPTSLITGAAISPTTSYSSYNTSTSGSGSLQSSPSPTTSPSINLIDGYAGGIEAHRTPTGEVPPPYSVIEPVEEKPWYKFW